MSPQSLGYRAWGNKIVENVLIVEARGLEFDSPQTLIKSCALVIPVQNWGLAAPLGSLDSQPAQPIW